MCCRVLRMRFTQPQEPDWTKGSIKGGKEMERQEMRGETSERERVTAMYWLIFITPIKGGKNKTAVHCSPKSALEYFA